MTTTTKGRAPICQHKEWERPRGCRKRATRAIQYLVLFGHQVTGTGDKAIYVPRVSFYCDGHEAPTEKQAELPIGEYFARMERAS